MLNYREGASLCRRPRLSVLSLPHHERKYVGLLYLIPVQSSNLVQCTCTSTQSSVITNGETFTELHVLRENLHFACISAIYKRLLYGRKSLAAIDMVHVGLMDVRGVRMHRCNLSLRRLSASLSKISRKRRRKHKIVRYCRAAAD